MTSPRDIIERNVSFTRMPEFPPIIAQNMVWIVMVLGVLAVWFVRTSKAPRTRIITIVALSVLGLYLLADLTYIKFTNSSGACDLSETISCSAVNTSEFSEVLGVPMSFFGMAYFLAALFLALRKKEQEKNMAALFLITVLAIIPGIYLSVIEYFVIDAICVYCEASKVLMVAIAIIAWPLAKKSGFVRQQAVVGLVLLGIIGSAFTYMLQIKTAGLGDDHTALAQCLTEKGVVMYGSFTCANCARQRRILGNAFEYIKEIECNPEGENPEPQRCVNKKITHTPTWIQEDENQGELLRADYGYRTPKELAEIFGCQEAVNANANGSG